MKHSSKLKHALNIETPTRQRRSQTRWRRRFGINESPIMNSDDELPELPRRPRKKAKKKTTSSPTKDKTYSSDRALWLGPLLKGGVACLVAVVLFLGGSAVYTAAYENLFPHEVRSTALHQAITEWDLGLLAEQMEGLTWRECFTADELALLRDQDISGLNLTTNLFDSEGQIEKNGRKIKSFRWATKRDPFNPTRSDGPNKNQAERITWLLGDENGVPQSITFIFSEHQPIGGARTWYCHRIETTVKGKPTVLRYLSRGEPGGKLGCADEYRG